MWPGETVAILASGPSMSAEVATAVRASGVRAIAINNTFKLAPWADLLYAADARWWDVHKDEALKFEGLKVTIMETPYGLLQLADGGCVGFDDDTSKLRTGHNSGYQAVHLAVHAGAKRILLCGMDMQGKHWHPEHKPPLVINEEAFFIRCIQCFREVAPELKRRGVEVWNCTPHSALKCFERVDLAQALALSAVSKAA